MQALISKYLSEIFPIVNARGRTEAVLCIFMTFYIDKGWEREKRMGVAEAFAQYQAMFGDKLNWGYVDGDGRWQQARSAKLPKLHEFLAPENLEPGTPWSLHYHGGTAKEDAHPYSFRALGSTDWEEDLGYVRCSVAIEWFLDHLEEFVSLIHKWCELFKPFHGIGGIGVAETPSFSTSHHPQLKGVAVRFPGIELDYPHFDSLYLDSGIRGVNWLTIVNDALLSQLEDIEQNAKKMDNGFQIIRYQGGAIFRAGKTPQSGDLNRQQFPELYRESARILKKLRIVYPSRIGPFRKEEAQKWLARFD